MDLEQPLIRLHRLSTPDGLVHAGLFKYESLPMFCFNCEILGHRVIM